MISTKKEFTNNFKNITNVLQSLNDNVYIKSILKMQES